MQGFEKAHELKKLVAEGSDVCVDYAVYYPNRMGMMEVTIKVPLEPHFFTVNASNSVGAVSHEIRDMICVNTRNRLETASLRALCRLFLLSCE